MGKGVSFIYIHVFMLCISVYIYNTSIHNHEIWNSYSDQEKRIMFFRDKKEKIKKRAITDHFHLAFQLIKRVQTLVCSQRHCAWLVG